MFFWLSHSFFVVLKYFFAPLLVIIFFQVIIQSHDSTRNTNNYIFQLICSTTSSFFYNRIEIWSFQLPNVQGKGLPLLVVPLGTTSRNFPKTVIIFFSKNQFFTLYIFLLLAHFWNLSCLPNFCFCNSSLVDVKAFQQLFLLLKELDLVMFGSIVLLNNTNIEEVQNPIVGTIGIFNLLHCELLLFFIFFDMHVKFV